MLSSCKENNHFILYWDDKFHSTIEAGHKHGAIFLLLSSKARPEGKELLVQIAKPRKPHSGEEIKMASRYAMHVDSIINCIM